MSVPKLTKKFAILDAPAGAAEARPAAATPPAAPPTLSDAFTTLALALHAHYSADDHIPICLQLESCQRLHADGNVLIAWSQLIPLLEGALGARLTHT